MKRTKELDISSFFSKRIHIEASSPVSPPCEASPQKLDDEIIVVRAGSKPRIKAAVVDKGRLSEKDVMNLPQDPGKRRKMTDFHPDDRDIVRREYIQRKPYQPDLKEFPQRLCGSRKRRFSSKWYGKYKSWLEYSVEKDAAFCFACYLFPKNSKRGGDAFVSEGFKNWKRLDALDKHVGGHMSAHNIAMGRLNDFRDQKSCVSFKIL